jgi:hypothetical protein
MLIQAADKFPGVIIAFESVRGQVEGVIVLEGILSQQNGLPGAPRTHDPDEMLAFLAHELFEEKALAGIRLAIPFGELVHFQ